MAKAHLAERTSIYDNILHIQLFFEPIAYNHLIFLYQPLRMKLLYEIDVERRRGLQIDVVLQRLFQHK